MMARKEIDEVQQMARKKIDEVQIKLKYHLGRC